MPRYGDLDALEKKLFPMGMVDDGRYALPAKAVKVAIDRLPTADVVPRTVIAEIFEEIDASTKYFHIPDGCAIVSLKKIAELKEKYLGEKSDG